MKTLKSAIMLMSVALTLILSGCTKDSDAKVNDVKKTLFAESFNSLTALTDNGWTSIAQTGTKQWSVGIYSGDGYAQMSSYQSGNPVNVAWLISPAINMDTQTGETLYFQTCQDGFVHNTDNSLELFVSTDYDGTNFTTAGWQSVNYNGVTPDSTRYIYIDSGFIDLSSYTGTLHFAFKYKGTTSLSGGYQVDNIRIFY